MLYKDALEFDLAIESFLRALKVSPNDTNIKTNLAAAYSRFVGVRFISSLMLISIPVTT